MWPVNRRCFVLLRTWSHLWYNQGSMFAKLYDLYFQQNLKNWCLFITWNHLHFQFQSHLTLHQATLVCKVCHCMSIFCINIRLLYEVGIYWKRMRELYMFIFDNICLSQQSRISNINPSCSHTFINSVSSGNKILILLFILDIYITPSSRFWI
jgi:hypothetical protein